MATARLGETDRSCPDQARLVAARPHTPRASNRDVIQRQFARRVIYGQSPRCDTVPCIQCRFLTLLTAASKPRKFDERIIQMFSCFISRCGHFVFFFFLFFPNCKLHCKLRRTELFCSQRNGTYGTCVTLSDTFSRSTFLTFSTILQIFFVNAITELFEKVNSRVT